MKKGATSRSVSFKLRLFLLALSIAGMFLAVLATASPRKFTDESPHDVATQPHGLSAITLAPFETVQEAWVARYNGPGHDFDAAEAIVVDKSGNVYVTGRSWILTSLLILLPSSITHKGKNCGLLATTDQETTRIPLRALPLIKRATSMSLDIALAQATIMTMPPSNMIQMGSNNGSRATTAQTMAMTAPKGLPSTAQTTFM